MIYYLVSPGFCFLPFKVRLQPPVVYQTVKLLARFLLCRGGVTSTNSLYDFYMSCPELAEGRQYFGESDGSFLFIIFCCYK